MNREVAWASTSKEGTPKMTRGSRAPPGRQVPTLRGSRIAELVLRLLRRTAAAQEEKFVEAGRLDPHARRVCSPEKTHARGDEDEEIDEESVRERRRTIYHPLSTIYAFKALGGL